MKRPQLKAGLSGTLMGVPNDALRFDAATYEACQRHHKAPMYGCPVCFLLLLSSHAVALAAEPILRGVAEQYDKAGQEAGMPELFAARDQLHDILRSGETARQAILARIVNPKGRA